MTGSTIKGITVVINGETTQLSKALSKLREQTKGLSGQLQGVNKLLKVNPTSLTMIGQKQDILNRSIATYQKKLNEAISAEREAYSKRSQWSEKDRENYEKLQREVESTKQKISSLTDEAVAFGSAASASVIAAKAQYAALGDTLVDAGKKLTVLSAGTALIGGYSIYAAAKYESAFAGVRKTVDATEAQFEDLSDTIREMALTKPIDATDIAYAAELGGQLGIAVENLDQFAGVIADLDVATNLDLETASMKLAQFANIAGIGEDNFDRLGSTIVDLGNNSATTESKIMNMAMRVAGSGSNIGLSAQEILALSTALSSVGIEAEMGGNAISTIMNRIDKDVALSTDTLQVWADTAGMSAEAFAAAWDNPDTVMDAFLAVVDGMATYRDEGGNLNTLLADMDISYMRQIDTMQRLSRTGDIVNEMVDIANTAWDENIALTREANRRYETTENQLKLVKNNFKEIAMQLGEIMTPSLKELSGNLVDILQDFQKLDDKTKQNIVGFLGLATAAGPVTLALGGVAKGISWLIGKYASGITQLALLTRGTASFTGAADAAAAATARTAAKAKVLNTALATLGTVATVAAVVAVALLVKSFMDAAERAENLRKATDGLRDSTDALDKSMLDTQGTMDSLDASKPIKTINQVKDSIDECIKAQAELAEEFEETWGEINGSEYALGKYTETIRELTDGVDDNGNAAKLNADEQAALRAAVAGVNEILGTSITVLDAENGLLSESTDLILANADAWLVNAKYKAAAEGQNSVMMQQYENEYNLGLAQDAYASAKARYEANPDSWPAYQEYAEAEEYLKEMEAAYEAGAAKVEWYTEKVAEFSVEMSHSTAGIKEFIEGSELWTETLDGMGIDIDDLSLKLSQLGFSTEDLNGITAEQLAVLAETFGLSTEEIATAFEKLGIELPKETEEAIEGAAQAVTDNKGLITEELEKMRGELIAEVDLYDGLYASAQNGLQGLYDGFSLSTDLGQSLSSRFSSNATKLLEKFREAAGEGSPWRTMIQSGRFANEGLAIGFSKYSHLAEDEAENLGSSSVAAMQRGLDGSRTLALLSSGGDYGAAMGLVTGASSSVRHGDTINQNYYIDGINVNGTTDAQFAAEFVSLMRRYGRLANT